jgi:hypothetical protein
MPYFELSVKTGFNLYEVLWNAVEITAQISERKKHAQGRDSSEKQKEKCYLM